MERHLQKSFITDIELRRYEHNVEVGHFIQGDLNSSYVGFNIKNNNIPYDLTDCQVLYNIKKPDGTRFEAYAEIVMPTRGYIECNISGQALVIEGVCELELSILKKGARLTTHRVRYIVNPSLFENLGVSQDEIKILTDLIDSVNKYTNQVIEAEKLRQASETQRCLDEEERNQSESQRKLDEEARKQDNLQMKEDESIRQSNETSRQQYFEQIKVEIEGKLTSIDSISTNISDLEDSLIKAESQRESDESVRKSNELSRQESFATIVGENTTLKQSLLNVIENSENKLEDITTKETEWIVSEDERNASEEQRRNDEESRNSNEVIRSNNETTRVKSEEQRRADEELRKQSNIQMNEDEKVRQTQEAKRVQDDKDRNDKFNRLISEMEITSSDISDIINFIQ